MERKNTMINLGFLGAGNMGFAIIKGILEKVKNSGAQTGDHSNSISLFAFSRSISISAYEPDSGKVERLKQLGVTICSSENELVSKCEFILLAVKPQTLGDILDKVRPSVRSNHVFISICAGISSEFIKEHAGSGIKTAIVMPNTPAMLGLGASAIARDQEISDREFEFAKSVIECCGIVREIPMDKMKEIICINGSSPAFIYLFAKAFADYAQEAGIDGGAALELFAQTLTGSAKMITDSGMSLEQLIKQVSSPGGTTLAGLEKLYEGRLEETVRSACEACTKRAYELAEK